MPDKIITIIYFIVRMINKYLRRKDAEIAKNREKAIETLEDKTSSKQDKLNALRDLSK